MIDLRSVGWEDAPVPPRPPLWSWWATGLLVLATVALVGILLFGWKQEIDSLFPSQGSALLLPYATLTWRAFVVPLLPVLAALVAAWGLGALLTGSGVSRQARRQQRERRGARTWNRLCAGLSGELEGERPLSWLETDRPSEEPEFTLTLLVLLLQAVLAVELLVATEVGKALITDPLQGPPTLIAILFSLFAVPWLALPVLPRTRLATWGVMLPPMAMVAALLLHQPALRAWALMSPWTWLALAVHGGLLFSFLRAATRRGWLLLTDRGARMVDDGGRVLRRLDDPSLACGPAPWTGLLRESVRLLPRMVFLAAPVLAFGFYFQVAGLLATYAEMNTWVHLRFLVDPQDRNARTVEWFLERTPEKGRLLYWDAGVKLVCGDVDAARTRLEELRVREAALPFQIDAQEGDAWIQSRLRREVPRFRDRSEEAAGGWEPQGAEARSAFRRGMNLAASAFFEDQDRATHAWLYLRRAMHEEPAAPGPRLMLAWLLVNHFDALVVPYPPEWDRDEEAEASYRRHRIRGWLEVVPLLEPLLEDPTWAPAARAVLDRVPLDLYTDLRDKQGKVLVTPAELAPLEAALPDAVAAWRRKEKHAELTHEALDPLVEDPPADATDLMGSGAWGPPPEGGSGG